MRLKFIILLFGFTFLMRAQEFKAEVIMNTDLVPDSDMSSYESLQKQVFSFFNNTRFTNVNLQEGSKIPVTLVINITKRAGQNDYEANLTILSKRLINESKYYSTILSIKDNDFSFNYLPYSSLIYNRNKYDRNNIVSVLSYYAYVMLGFHAESIAQGAGLTYFKVAEEIVGQAQGSNYGGWSSTNRNNRYSLINNILSQEFKVVMDAYYQYHRLGLDTMAEDVEKGKRAIYNSLDAISKMDVQYTDNYLLRVFFNSKSDEIVEIFSDGPVLEEDFKGLRNRLTTLFPTYESKWKEIKG